jgi:hypothetical protein
VVLTTPPRKRYEISNKEKVCEVAKVLEEL